MGFGEAINLLKCGYKVTRQNWNGKGQYICLGYMKECCVDDNIIKDPQHVNIGSKFIMFVGTSGCQCGWLASQADLLADDWCVI